MDRLLGANDPYYLHPKQRLAFNTAATELLFGGAAGPGKSHLLRVAAILWCLEIPGLQVYIFRRTFPDLWKNHMEGPGSFPVLLADQVNRKTARINYSENFIEFDSRSKIFLCHCQYEHDVYKYKGAEMHVLMPDELTSFTEPIYRFLRGRVRLGGLKIPAKYKGLFPRIVSASNPGDVGHNWVKLSFIDNAPAYEIKRMPRTEGGMLRQFIPGRLEDNPTLTENDPDYEQRLEGLGDPALVRAMRVGDWDIVAGGMFDDLFKRDVHAIEPFEIPSSWRVDRSFDWGSSRPFSVGWWAQSDGTRAPNGRTYPRGTLFRIGEWYGWNGRANEGLRMLAPDIAAGILEHEAKLKALVKGSIDPGPADTSIFDSGTIDNVKSLADVMGEQGVHWTEADKSPGSRKTGWQRLREYLKASLASPMESPGIFIFNTCEQWLRTVPVLPRDKSKPDDVDTKAEDHTADETRYRILCDYTLQLF